MFGCGHLPTWLAINRSIISVFILSLASFIFYVQLLVVTLTRSKKWENSTITTDGFSCCNKMRVSGVFPLWGQSICCLFLTSHIQSFRATESLVLGNVNTSSCLSLFSFLSEWPMKPRSQDLRIGNVVSWHSYDVGFIFILDGMSCHKRIVTERIFIIIRESLLFILFHCFSRTKLVMSLLDCFRHFRPNNAFQTKQCDTIL